MKIINCIQGSEEWFKARAGVPSSSNFDKVVTGSGLPSKQQEKYIYQLVGESLLGTKEEGYQNVAMQRGTEMEGEARDLYSMISGETVIEVGFCIADNLFKYGASPDGLVGDDGLLEIKCPNLATHVGYLLDNKMPSTYFQQVQGQMLVTARKWVDFMSYYPGIKPFIIRVYRDDTFLHNLRAELERLCVTLNTLTNKLK